MSLLAIGLGIWAVAMLRGSGGPFAMMALWIGISAQWAIRYPHTFTWRNLDGANHHDFRPTAPRKAVPNGLGRSRFDRMKARFENLEIHDPQIGAIELTFGDEYMCAVQRGKTAFEARRLTKDEAAGLGPNQGKKNRVQVSADPALHPDTIERLVELYAISLDEWHIYGYMLWLETAEMASVTTR